MWLEELNAKKWIQWVLAMNEWPSAVSLEDKEVKEQGQIYQ